MLTRTPLKALVLLIAFHGAVFADIRGDLRAQLLEHEGVRLEAYRDSGGWSIGVGHHMGAEPDMMRITRGQAMDMLDEDIQETIRALDAQLGWWRTLHPVRQQALANMAYCHGMPRLLAYPVMLSHLRRHEYELAALAALDSLWAREQAPERAAEIAYMLRTATLPAASPEQ